MVIRIPADDPFGRTPAVEDTGVVPLPVENADPVKSEFENRKAVMRQVCARTRHLGEAVAELQALDDQFSDDSDFDSVLPRYREQVDAIRQRRIEAIGDEGVANVFDKEFGFIAEARRIAFDGNTHKREVAHEQQTLNDSLDRFAFAASNANSPLERQMMLDAAGTSIREAATVGYITPQDAELLSAGFQNNLVRREQPPAEEITVAGVDTVPDTATDANPALPMEGLIGKSQVMKISDGKISSADEGGAGGGTEQSNDSANGVPGRGRNGLLHYPEIKLDRVSQDNGNNTRSNNGAPVVNMSRDRINAILSNRLATFGMADNPSADGSEPWYAVHMIGYVIVRIYSDLIEAEAKKVGVDPDLIRAIMYVENSQGGTYGYPSELLGRSETIMPMNINPAIWGSLAGDDADFSDPHTNIRAAAILVRRIADRVPNPSVAKVASIYNSSGGELVNDYGARVAEVYKGKSWANWLQ